MAACYTVDGSQPYQEHTRGIVIYNTKRFKCKHAYINKYTYTNTSVHVYAQAAYIHTYILESDVKICKPSAASKICRRGAHADLQGGTRPRPCGALSRLFRHLPKEDSRKNSARSRDSVARKSQTGDYHTVGDVSMNAFPKIEYRVWSIHGSLA